MNAKSMMKIGCLLLTLLLTSCITATQYQALSDTGGYEDTRVDADVFGITFLGNGVTSRSAVQDMALLRAAEITRDNGFLYFVIEGSHTNTSNQKVNVHYKTLNLWTGEIRPSTMPDLTYNIANFATQLIIKCYREKPDGDFAVFNAANIYDYLSPKYKQNSDIRHTLTASAAAAPMTPERSSEVRLVENCEGGGMGGAWYTYSDANQNGGSSTSFFQNTTGQGANGTRGFARCHGTVTTRFQYGFSGLGYNFIKKGSPIDISKYSGFIFWFKGDGGSYLFAVKSIINTDYAYFEYRIKSTTEWKQYKIPFGSLAQESWGQVKSLADCVRTSTGFEFQTLGQPIPQFEFDVDEISLYRD